MSSFSLAGWFTSHCSLEFSKYFQLPTLGLLFIGHLLTNGRIPANFGAFRTSWVFLTFPTPVLWNYRIKPLHLTRDIQQSAYFSFETNFLVAWIIRKLYQLKQFFRFWLEIALHQIEHLFLIIFLSSDSAHFLNLGSILNVLFHGQMRLLISFVVFEIFLKRFWDQLNSCTNFGPLQRWYTNTLSGGGHVRFLPVLFFLCFVFWAVYFHYAVKLFHFKRCNSTDNAQFFFAT